MRKKEKKEGIDTLLKKDQKKLTPRDRRRVRDYLVRKAKNPPFDQKCQVCGKAIPKPFEVCSSKCRKKLNERKKKNRKAKY